MGSKAREQPEKLLLVSIRWNSRAHGIAALQADKFKHRYRICEMSAIVNELLASASEWCLRMSSSVYPLLNNSVICVSTSLSLGSWFRALVSQNCRCPARIVATSPRLSPLFAIAACPRIWWFYARVRGMRAALALMSSAGGNLIVRQTSVDHVPDSLGELVLDMPI